MNLNLALKRGQKQEDSTFLAGEFIGKTLQVVSSSGKGLQKASGRIVDETTNTFVVETQSGRKAIPKNSCVFKINGVEVNGKSIIGRPEDRTKKFL